MTDPTPHTPVRLAVLDDHPIVLTGLRALGSLTDGAVQVVLAASTPEELRQHLPGSAVDVALVDLMIDDELQGPEMIRELTDLGIPCVVYTAEIRPLPVRRAIGAGALGLVLKNDPIDALLHTILTAATGEPAVSSELAELLVHDPDLLPSLSPREVEVLRLLHLGVPRKAVGRLLDPPAADASVATYLRRAVGKYRSAGRRVDAVHDAVHQAEQDGWFE